MSLIAPTLQAFFTDRRARQLQASPRTIASYRDTLRLLVCFVQERTGKAPSSLECHDLDETLISSFLEHLEVDRGNRARTRNLRLTAIRSLFRYAALRHPEHADVIQRVLSISPKRFERRTVTFLAADEAKALIDAPDHRRWEGRRDRALLVLAIQAGLRVSELVALDCGSVALGTGAHVRCEGKGRKQRSVPLTAPAQTVLASWLTERAGGPHDPLFPTRTGRRLSRDAAMQSSAAWPPTPPPQRSDAIPQEQEAPPSRAQAQLRHVAAAGRGGQHRDRALARPRRCPLHPALPPRRSHDQGASPGAGHAGLRPARPLQATRRRAHLPRRPVTMPCQLPRGRGSTLTSPHAQRAELAVCWRFSYQGGGRDLVRSP